MAESSILWTTDGTGDGTGSGYTMAQVIRWMRHILLRDNTTQGVYPDYLNELEVTGASSPVAVNTGGACVYGFDYNNSASENVAVPTPSANTRIDRIVLEADWTAQTVRIARVAGTEGTGTPPSLTQSDGTTWQISLAQASITTGGVITVTDERKFIRGRTQKFLVQATTGYNATDTAWKHRYDYGVELEDSDSTICKGGFMVPENFVSDMSVSVVIVSDYAGNGYFTSAHNYGADGEGIAQHSDSAGAAAVAITSSATDEVNVVQSVDLDDAAIGDYVELSFQRDATNAADTCSGSMYLHGWMVSYMADN